MSVATDALGVLGAPLARSCVRQALARFRLPKYSALAEFLHDYDVTMLARTLWRGLFPGEPLPQGNSYDIEVGVLSAISAKYFPLDEAMIDSYYECDDRPLHAQIDAETYGIPWEMGDDYSCLDPVRALLYVVCDGLEQSPWHNHSLMDELYEKAAEWMMDHGYLWPQGDWLRHYGMIEAELAELPVPLNGLAAVYKCLRRNTGNQFYDLIDGCARYEYEQWGSPPWTVLDVQMLARQYDEAKDDLDAMFEYQQWYGRQGNADDAVLAALAQVFDLKRTDEGMDDD